MKGKKLGLLVLAGTLALGVASCGDKGSWNYEDYEFENANATASAATSGTVENFVASSYEEREKILGLLEEYAIKNNLTGLVLYDDGGYGKYNPRVKFPTNKIGNVGGTDRYDYVTGYGFGITAEGELDGELSGVTTYKTYLHTYETEDPKTLNYMNDKGSVVGGYVGYVSSSYFDTKLNATKDGYEWFSSLGTDKNQVEGHARPLPLNKDGALVTNPTLSTLTNKYRIYVRTGADMVYNTLGSLKDDFAGTEVKLEDYVTPWQQLFTQANGLARGAENLTGAASIKGMADYYNESATGFNATAWSKVGIKTGTDSDGAYMDFEFNTPCTPFYAMYYLSSPLYAPIPASFLDAIGGIKSWGSSVEKTGGNLSPVDTTLSTGPYVVEAWQSDVEFVFKKNELANTSVLGGDHRYKIPGVHVDILKAATTDPLAAWNEYQAGKLDSVGIPKDKLQAERDTANTQVTKGSSTTKLNVNSCTQEEWEYLFGVNGTITQTQPSDYWEVEPALSNDDFLMGLNLGLDRKAYATNHGVTPSLNYFSDNYLIDPENGVSYNNTDTHKNVMTKIFGEGWDSYEYNVDKAREYFDKASKALIANGFYKEGDTITIEIAWQAEAQIQNNGAEIKTFLEDAFNHSSVNGQKLTLEIENMAVAVWSDVYYKKMMVGQFDIGFGGISGNPLNPINFMEVLKSDNSSGFTLNWGTNTNDPDLTIEYDGKEFTFDALFQAADTGAVVASDGSLAKTYDAQLAKNVRNEDGTRSIEIKYAMSNIANVVTTSLADVVLCWYDGEEYDEQSVDYTVEGNTIKITISQELAESYQGNISFDLIFTQTLAGSDPTNPLISLNSLFPIWEE